MYREDGAERCLGGRAIWAVRGTAIRSVRGGCRGAGEFTELSPTRELGLNFSIAWRELEERRSSLAVWAGLLIALPGAAFLDVEVGDGVCLEVPLKVVRPLTAVVFQCDAGYI